MVNMGLFGWDWGVRERSIDIELGQGELDGGLAIKAGGEG